MYDVEKRVGGRDIQEVWRDIYTEVWREEGIVEKGEELRNGRKI